MKMLSREGVEMMEVKSIEREGERLIIRGKVMGSMPTTICLRPEDIWAAWHLMSWDVICRLPLMLLKGFRRRRVLRRS
jgi:hypothetical protein